MFGLVRSTVFPAARNGLRWSVTARYQSCFSTELDDKKGIAIVKMQKKPVNAVDKQFFDDLHTVLEDLESNNTCRGLILTSAFPGIFSAGIDLGLFLKNYPNDFRPFWESMQSTWAKLYKTKLVTIAAVNGIAPTAGCVISLACDYRIMATGQKYHIGLNEAQLGVIVAGWISQRYADVIGLRQAEKSLQKGVSFTPETALKSGLVDHICDESELLNEAEKEMKKWLAISDDTRTQLKEAYRRQLYEDITTNHDKYTDFMVDVAGRPSAQNTLKAIVQKMKQSKPT